MRIRYRDSVSTVAPVPAGEVLAVASDLSQLSTLVSPDLDPASQLDRSDPVWALAPVGLAGLRLRPVCRMAVAVAGRTVTLTGRPVGGFAPCWLEVAVEISDAAPVDATFELEVVAPLPSFAAGTARRIAARRSREVSDALVVAIGQLEPSSLGGQLDRSTDGRRSA